MRMLAIVLAIALIGVGVWVFTRDGGVLQQVTEERVSGALQSNGVPQPVAECMAPKLTDRLSIAQLQKLEELAPQGSDEPIPQSRARVMDRLRRVNDSEAVSALVSVATGCSLEVIGVDV